MNPLLELVAVRKGYAGFKAVDGVSLAVEPGSICGLLGPNGAGKTTSIRMIMDIIAPDAGEVRFFGRPRQRERPKQNDITPRAVKALAATAPPIPSGKKCQKSVISWAGLRLMKSTTPQITSRLTMNAMVWGIGFIFGTMTRSSFRCNHNIIITASYEHIFTN